MTRSRSLFSRLLRRRLVVALVALPVFAALALVLPQPALAESTEDDSPRLAAVYFRLEDGVDAGSGPLSDLGDKRPASYRSFSVVDGGETRRVAPVSGSTAIRLAGTSASATTAQVGSASVGVSDPNFGNALADALAAPRVDRMVRLDQGPNAEAVAIDLTFSRPLGATDYLLIQESGGDASVTVTPVGTDGTLLGAGVDVAGSYQWDTGRTDIDGSPLWISVISVPATVDGSPTPGVRVEARQAQLKVLALSDFIVPVAGSDPVVESAATAGTASSASGDGSSTASGQLQEADVPAVKAGLASASQTDQTPTSLAMTGAATDPWMMTFIAMGLIFFGWTIVAALGRRDDAHSAGHAQLDALGFD